MSKYYCLIAGLPEISADDQKLPFTVKEFKEEVYEQLSKDDRRLFDLYYLTFDNANLLRFLRDREAELDLRGALDCDALELLVKSAKEEENFSVVGAAPYFKDFISAFIDEAPLSEGVLWEDQLTGLYYDYALKSSNHFVARWFEFNLNINNILVATAARKHHLDLPNFIVGDNAVAVALRTSTTRDWGLTGSIDYLDSLLRIAEVEDLLDRERRIDLLKWEWLEENTFFHYFTAERLFAYLLRIGLLERWMTVDKERGEAQLREMIARLKSEVKLPEDFEK